MFNTGTKKVIRDLFQDKRRTLTVLLAMIIGVFAVAMMGTSKSLLDNNLTENFLRTNPASFSLFVQNADESLLNYIEKMEAIEQATVRQSIWIRMKKKDETFLPVLLYVVDDVQNPKINTYKLVEGSLPMSKYDIVIERTGKKLENIALNQSLELHFPGYAQENYTLTGFTHDAGIAPSWMEGYFYAYISKSALPSIYLAQFPKEIKCTVAENEFNLNHIKAVAKQTQSKLEQKGISVNGSEINEPGVHMHQKQMNALMFLILNFGVLALILSCFLIINMISAIMAKEIKQIAIMKSTGASSIQIARIYIATILIIAMLSLVVGTPLGIIAGKAFATFNASMLNFELFNLAIEPLLLLIIALTGLCLPVLLSVFPILKSSRVPVQSALTSTGVESVQKQSFFFAALGQWFSGCFLLALKNAFRRKTRLALTVISLSIGGAIFITAFNVRKSTNNTIDNVFDKQAQDIQYTFSQSYDERRIDSALQPFDMNYEIGFKGQGTFEQANGLTSNAFNITAIEARSKLIVPVITEGRWLRKGKNEIVLNQILLKENKTLKIGDVVNLSINGKRDEFTLVGVCKEMFSPASLFMEKEDFAEQNAMFLNSGNFLLVDAITENQKEITALNGSIEQALKLKQVNIVNSITKADYKTAVVEHLLIIMAMLLSMTMLVVIVGGMGMATSININISERIRELGILGAIGILKQDIRAMVMTEALAMGGLSWVLAIILSLPLSAFLGNQFFTIFFESSMQLAVSPIGIVAWLILGLIIGIVSSIVPANRVIRRRVAEALSYG